MKIVINITGVKPLFYDKGGAIQKLVGYLVKDLKDEHQLIIVGQVAKKIKGIKVISQEKKFYDTTLSGFILEGIRGFLKIRSQTANIIISTHPTNFLASFLYSKLKKKPLTAWEMDHNFWVKPETGAKKIFHLLVGQADRVVTLSQIQKRRMVKRGVKPKKIIVIPGAVDTKKFTPSKLKRKKYLLSVGKFIESKNQLILLQAFKKLTRQKRFSDFKLYLVGPISGAFSSPSLIGSDYFHQCRDYIHQEHLGEKVKFHQNISEKELINLYQRAALFVFPSKEEGFGLSLLEAMACGCPCIVSDIEPLSEVLDDAGELVNTSRADILAKRMKKILKDQKLADKLSKLARKRVVSHFNTQIVSKRLKDLFKEIR